MPEILAGVVVVVIIVGLGVAFGLRAVVVRVSRDMTSDLERLSAALGDVRNEVDELRRELADVKAANETVAIPPPLPKARSGRLDDLREQLRAAHRESEASSEE